MIIAQPIQLHSKGFTLIEVLVAMTIMSVLAVMAWQGIDSMVRSRDYSQARIDQTLLLNTVLSQWEQDLKAIQETVIPSSPSNVPLPALSFDGNTVRILRKHSQGLQWVNWSLRPEANTGNKQLLRWVSRPMTGLTDLSDLGILSQHFVGTEPDQLRTLSGISDWQIYFFRGSSWSNAQSSGDNITSGDQFRRTETLPLGVRLVLSFAQTSGLNGKLTRDIRLGPVWQ